MTDITRRRVIVGAGAALGAAAVAGCASKATHAVDSSTGTATGGSPTAGATAGGSSASSSAGANGGSLELQVGPLADIPVGSGKLVTAGGNDLVVTQPVAGQPSVFVNRCTHAGCKVAIAGAQLICPCHESRFDLNGAVLNGPATQPLPQAILRVDNGQIIVEKL
ncbi:MAG: hypothetical protein QOF57_1546 [Frankiaceae bacterium]|jgi:Rieske Fe-S protein|nr:hypothetical protein [Frankiaceae bacterium]